MRGMLYRKMWTDCKQNALTYTRCGGSGLIPSKDISHFSGFRKVGDVFLDQTHDAEDDGRENCREYPVGD